MTYEEIPKLGSMKTMISDEDRRKFQNPSLPIYTALKPSSLLCRQLYTVGVLNDIHQHKFSVYKSGALD